MASTADVTSTRTVTVLERQADLFTAPKGTVLLHSCNTLGRWGAGIAKVLKTKYPHAYDANVAYCQQDGPTLGTALLVPRADDQGHFVGCLFTSAGVGRRKSPQTAILKHTKAAMGDLLGQIAEWNASHEEKVERLWMCKINSGLFKVPWAKSKAVLEKIELPDELDLEVVAGYMGGDGDEDEKKE